MNSPRVLVALALACIAFLAPNLAARPPSARAQATFLVTVTGPVRGYQLIGYENRQVPPRSYAPLEGPFVTPASGVRVQASPFASFSDIVFDGVLPPVTYVTRVPDGLPQIVPGADGVTDFRGTSGFVLADAGAWVEIAFQYEFFGRPPDASRLYWRAFLVGPQSILGGAGATTETGALVETSMLTVNVGTVES